MPKEKTNIFGGKNCKLPDGSVCRFCCFALAVPDLNKDSMAPCQHETGKGCAVHMQESQPLGCMVYRCEEDTNPVSLLRLAAVAESSGKVPPEIISKIRDKVGLPSEVHDVSAAYGSDEDIVFWLTSVRKISRN